MTRGAVTATATARSRRKAACAGLPVLAILMSLVVTNPTLANPDCQRDVLRLADAITTIQSEYERDGGKLSMVEAEDFVRKALPARVAPECLKPIDTAFAGQSLPLIDGALSFGVDVAKFSYGFRISADGEVGGVYAKAK